MLWESLTTARDLGRISQIATILARYGFGDMLRRFGLAGALERAGRVLPLEHLEELVSLSTPVRVRRALEEMGPCFVKLGQVLATRVDLFPQEWIAEFGKLQNQVPPVPFEEIRVEMREALGAEPEEMFAWLDPEPLAAASIAQVHRATLHDGSAVVVKVRRPGIRALVEADMRLLLRLAALLEKEVPELTRYQPSGVVRQFKASLMRELDLAAECRNAEHIADNFSGHPELVVPEVYWDLTSERMNVQEFIDGIPVTDLAALEAAGLDRREVARNGAQCVLKMLFEDGFFHADPHPGNVLCLPGNRFALLDYGMVGRLTDRRRGQLVELLHGMVRRDPEQVGEVLLDWAQDPKVDEDRLTLDIQTFVDRYHGVPLGELALADMMLEVAALLRDNHLTLPHDLALMIKVFVTLEGLGRVLDPDFDMASEAQPFLTRAMLARYSPDALVRRGWRAISDTTAVLTGLPRDLRKLLRAARSGQFRINIDVERLRRFGEQVDHSANRLTVGIVTAAMIIGSSIVMTVEGGPTLFGLPLFGLLGFLGAAVGAVWLVYSIWRSGGGR